MENSKTRLFFISYLSVLIAFSGFATRGITNENTRRAKDKTAVAFQFSTLPALSLGLYDGGMSFGEVLQHGDFGLGTFDALDGEGIILNGKAWRIRSDGKVSAVDKKTTTPFAVVTFFKPQKLIIIDRPLNYSELRSALQAGAGKYFSTPNAPQAIAVHGTFARIKVRSVPRQNKPYRALSEVVKTQSEWEWKNVRGTLVGFRFPSYLSQVNLADFHFHFLSDDKADDKKRGGHLLDCEIIKGDILIQTLRGLDLRLPADSDFDNANLSSDQSAALKDSEQQH